jgi:hypothetical protein
MNYPLLGLMFSYDKWEYSQFKIDFIFLDIHFFGI